jgi:hypothetical protein
LASSAASEASSAEGAESEASSFEASGLAGASEPVVESLASVCEASAGASVTAASAFGAYDPSPAPLASATPPSGAGPLPPVLPHPPAMTAEAIPNSRPIAIAKQRVATILVFTRAT